MRAIVAVHVDDNVVVNVEDDLGAVGSVLGELTVACDGHERLLIDALENGSMLFAAVGGV